MTPYIGASPDGLVCCSCCGEGVLEVKCPLCVKYNFPDEELKGFCMTKKRRQMDYKARSCLLLSSTDSNACMCVNASIVTLWFSLKMKELFLTGCWWMMFYDNIHNDLEHFFNMEYCPKL